MTLAFGRELPDRVFGTALEADLSGFTALTEALAGALGERLAATLDADEILVFDHGRPIERGRHDDLRAPAHRTLWEKQSGFQVGLVA